MRCEWWDGPLPEPGDFLRTEAGSCYLIDDWRPARPGSQSLGTFVCVRLERDAVAASQEGVYEWAFARRERGRRSERARQAAVVTITHHAIGLDA
jgi:hypothetical protein